MSPGSHPSWHGHVRGVYVAELAGVEMHAVDRAELVAGVGIRGDRYAEHRGHYSHMWHPDRQVTLIAAEVLRDIADETGVALEPVETRRNLVTEGVPLNDLVGERVRIGDVVLYGGRLNVPCRYLERLVGKPVFEPLVGRSGLNCRILVGGHIAPGDAVLPEPGGAP